jgi:hypothetical protein
LVTPPPGDQEASDIAHATHGDSGEPYRINAKYSWEAALADEGSMTLATPCSAP